jgi:hypothetical protein
MPSARHNAVYNSRIPHMRAWSSRFPRAACLCVLMLAHLPAILASDWRAPEEQLARKIAAATGPGAVTLEVVNRSSLSRPDAETIRRGLSAQLAALGVHFVNADQAAATVQITLSENLQSYLWVAEIHQGNNEASLVMVTTPRLGPPVVESSTAAFTIQKTPLSTDENRILDVALLNGASHSHPWPRDLRGRLALRKDHWFDAYLPGTFCRSSATAPLSLNCYDSDDPWPLGADQPGLSAFFAPTRNFFTGALSPGIEKQTTVKAFYSAAMLPREKYKLWIFSAVDGQVHLLDGVTDQTAAKLIWGSDIASVRSGCGLGWQVLVIGNGDGNGETVTAFEIADREPVAVSQPADFNGVITALWTESDSTGVIAVSRNSETGRYEAYRLSIACGH